PPVFTTLAEQRIKTGRLLLLLTLQAGQQLLTLAPLRRARQLLQARTKLRLRRQQRRQLRLTAVQLLLPSLLLVQRLALLPALPGSTRHSRQGQQNSQPSQATPGRPGLRRGTERGRNRGVEWRGFGRLGFVHTFILWFEKSPGRVSARLVAAPAGWPP